jgi:hypothetical protein
MTGPGSTCGREDLCIDLRISGGGVYRHLASGLSGLRLGRRACGEEDKEEEEGAWVRESLHVELQGAES